MISTPILSFIKKVKTQIIKILFNTVAFIFRHKLIFIILFFLIFLGYREYHKEVFIIEPFEVPENLHKNGLTGRAIANKINDKINFIRQEANASMEAIHFTTFSVDPLPTIVVPGTGISIRPFIRYFKSEFSPYKTKVVTGELFTENGLLYLTARVVGNPEKTFTPIETKSLMGVSDSNIFSDFDNLMLDVAIHTYRHTQPFILASYYESTNKDDEAMEIIKEIIRYKKGKSLAHAYNLGGYILEKQQKFIEASEMYDLAISEDPDFVYAYNNKANMYYEMGEKEQAKKLFRRVMRIESGNVYGFYGLGRAFYDDREYDKAIEYIDKVVEINPYIEAAYNVLGLIYYEQEKFNMAIDHFNKTLDINPAYSLAYYNLGLVYSNKKFENNNFSKAKEYFEKAIDLNPEESQFYQYFGISYIEEGNHIKGREYLEKAIELNPKNYTAHYQMGNSYYHEEDFSNARKYFQKSLDLKHDYPFAYYGLGQVFESERNYANAREMYEIVLEIDPGNWEAHIEYKMNNMPE